MKISFRRILLGVQIFLIILLLTSCGLSTFDDVLISPTITVVQAISESKPISTNTEIPIIVSVTATIAPSSEAISTVNRVPTSTPLPIGELPADSSIIDNLSGENLVQVSTVPNAGIRWQSDDVLRVRYDSSWSRETRCTTNYWQDYNVNKDVTNRSFDVLPLIVDEAVTCPEPAPLLSDDVLLALPGEIGYQIESSDQTHSLLIVEVISSTLPMIGDVEKFYPDQDLPILEGWVIEHKTNFLQPAFATQLGYVYVFLPDNRYIAVMQDCYGSFLGTGLHVVDVQSGSKATITENFSGLCEGGIGLAPSPNGKYLIHSKGIIVDVYGELIDQLCTEDQFARSWTWTSDSKRVYAACTQDGYDLIWQYDIETREKVLLNELLDLPNLLKLRRMTISPDEDWLAFVWGTSDLFAEDEFGVWLLDLDRVKVLD